jgi:arsenate reductase (thioredoxin)
MAEGFARVHGAHVIAPQSAGLAPAASIAPLTHKVMLEKNIDIHDLSPRSLDEVTGGLDLIINMSGRELPFKTRAPVEPWDVRDPIGESVQVYRAVRDDIEQRIIRLVASLDRRKPPASADGPATTQVDSRRRAPGK